ncbi:hypothetical protein GOBAR_AA38250 [Gossypium barbadense]|uniref:RNase H type-1 domain-containing protein n=1 Tax=Gossypium barbadense TaxID=3634 RepID=A0A2P5VUF0_GOSBA|nr:hypothetical protein GOBAR_AA38250 [Gossypium barbadense]
MARNKLLHENKVQIEASLIQFITDYIQEIEGVKEKLPVSSVFNEYWKPSRITNVKINFDTAFDKQNKRSCTGVVIRDTTSNVLKSITYKNEHIPIAFAVEALTCVQAVRFKAKLGFLPVEVESDAFKLARRQTNTVAHILATEGLKERGNTHLTPGLSSAVARTVAADKNGEVVGSGGLMT